MTIQELKEEVKKLSPQDRILLVEYALRTLEDEPNTKLSDNWQKELEARSEAFEKGESKTRSWSEIKQRLVSKN